ncbi:MAG: DNA repair protein RecN [Deltaproteobacteria bacterium]|nr:DNA repair protein RecN [Deltaproteobacteria bacterium]
MLVELSIKDFAIIESLTVSLGRGLNIFTGETGAGKSIIMDAISLILGDRASNEIIRTSKEEALVEAMFDVSGHAGIEGVLSEAGIPCSHDLIIKRVVQRAGRNRVYINGSLATLVTLTEVGRFLIDIYGQSEHQSLTRPDEHVEILDSFGGFGKLRAYMAESYREYVSVKKELDALLHDSKTSSEKKEFLEFQSKEIAEASFTEGEDEALKRLKEKLSNAERIKNITEEAERLLYSESGSAVERLGSVVKALKELSTLDDRLASTAKSLEESLFAVEDSASFLRSYSESIEADPDGLESVLARIDLINRLKKKYGATIPEILRKKEDIERELTGLSDFEERLATLEVKAKEAKKKAEEAAASLTEARTASAVEIEKRVEEEIGGLGMKGAVFEVSIETERNADGTLRFGEKGAERVNFFIATNKGEGLKPLARVASGGELSRIMLAIKSVTAAGRVPTLIFDEIDAGVGGAMAQVVGLKLKEVALANQVLCITHSPQIAAFADKHFGVEKRTSGGRTTTSVAELGGPESLEQISRMLGGMKVTDITRQHATELVEAARSLSSKKIKGAEKKRQA